MALNFNIDPYFDDFDEKDKFYRLLFRPGYPVQARELTQMQSILQNQIAKHAEHIFKQGSMVIPGQVSYEDDFKYVKLQSIYNGVDVNTYLSEIVGQEIIGQSSGVKAFVLHELAQPLHAFDADKIEGNKVIVKKLAQGSKFITLDEVVEVVKSK